MKFLEKFWGKGEPSFVPETCDRETVDAASSLSPEKVASIMRQALSGDIKDQCRLARELPEHNIEIAQALQTRTDAALGCRWRFCPGDDSDGAKAAAEALEKELAALGKPVVLLNFSGRPTILTWEQQNIPAIMNVWFGGSEAADAICDVVFGDKNPSGRLTMTMPQSLGQVPLYYNHMNTGRPVPDDADGYRKYQSNYFEVRNGALYPFGYGLSYTTVEYGKPELGLAKGRTADDLATVSVTVKNTGSRATDEVVQLYINDPAATIVRPVKELKGFQRIPKLKKGASYRNVSQTAGRL